MSQTRIPGEKTETRERIERTWHRRMTRDHDLAPLVTARGARNEPFHRWLVFKQAFSPELVRIFLSQADGLNAGSAAGRLLDPFSGTGTFVVECARRNVRAIGVDPLLAPSFVTRAKAVQDVPDVPDLDGCRTWQDLAERLTTPIHRAALICAVASQHTARGKLNSNAKPITEAFDDTITMMSDDIRRPLPWANPIFRGDGRRLDFLADESVGGILTSPPYLSRHDYTKVTQAYESVYAYWYKPEHAGHPGCEQLPAHPKARHQRTSGPGHPAVAEIVGAMFEIRQKKLAHIVRTYFGDLFAAVDECRRVLRRGAPCWIVIGGARQKDVYIPTDTILADFANSTGFTVDQFRVARNVIPTGRRFGTLTDVAPRESILIMHKR